MIAGGDTQSCDDISFGISGRLATVGQPCCNTPGVEVRQFLEFAAVEHGLEASGCRCDIRIGVALRFQKHSKVFNVFCQWSRAMIFKRVDIATCDPFGSLLQLGEHVFGGLFIVTQRDRLELAILIGHAPPKGFRLHTNAPRPVFPSQLVFLRRRGSE